MWKFYFIDESQTYKTEQTPMKIYIPYSIVEFPLLTNEITFKFLPINPPTPTTPHNNAPSDVTIKEREYNAFIKYD